MNSAGFSTGSVPIPRAGAIPGSALPRAAETNRLLVRSFAITIVVASVISLLALAARPVSAALITVRQDSTGDFTSLTDAISASLPGDSIEVGPGVYTQPKIFMLHSLTLYSTLGPDTTALDGEDLNQIFETSGASTVVLVEGFTFTRGQGFGGSFRVVSSSQVTTRDCLFEQQENTFVVGANSRAIIYDCLFQDNNAPSTGAALYTSGTGAHAEIYGTSFRNNNAVRFGAAIATVFGGHVLVNNCVFEDNASPEAGGAIHVAGTADIEQSLFLRNASALGAAVRFDGAGGTVVGNTFHENISSASSGSTVSGTDANQIDRNIFSNQVMGYGLSTASNNHACNLFWNNADGPISGTALAPDDIVADPLFCGPDLTIAPVSPAAAAHSPCGQQIGALGVNCPPPPGPNIAVTDTALVFNSTYLVEQDTMAFFIKNLGGLPLTGSATSSSAEFTVLLPSYNIPANDSAQSPVVFSPMSRGVYSDSVVLISDDVEADTIYVALHGTGIDHTTITVSPDSIHESMNAGEFRDVPLTVSNPEIVGAPIAMRLVMGSLPPASSQTPTSFAFTPDPPTEAWESAGGPVLTPVASSPRQWRARSAVLTDFVESFDSGVLIGWEDSGSAALKEITSQTSAAGPRSYREANSVWGHHNGIFWDFGSIQPQHIEFWVRSGSESTFDSYFTLRDSQYREAIFFLTQADGNFYVNGNVGGHTTYPYAAGTWYKIELRNIDFGARSFDYAVDDSLVQTGISFRNAALVTDFGPIDLYNYDENAMGGWDEIKISPGPPSNWIHLNPWAGTAPPGQSSSFSIQLDTRELVPGSYDAIVIVEADVPDPKPRIDSVFVTVTIGGTSTGTPDDHDVPLMYNLGPNVPNPFNPSTTITYDLPQRSDVNLIIYDVKGRRVYEFNQGIRHAGRYSVDWSAIDSHGQPVASGVYFYRLTAGAFQQTRKMVLLK